MEQPDDVPVWPFEELADHYRLAYDAAMDAARDQRDRVDEVRNRAVTLVSVSVAVWAFLGGGLFAANASVRLETGWGPFSSRVAVVLAVVALAVVVGTAIWAWRPVEGSFTLSGRAIVDIHIEGQWPVLKLAELLRELALSMVDNVDANRRTLNRRQRALGWAMVSLGSELMLLLLTRWDLVK